MGYPHLWKPPSEFGTSQQDGSTETRPAGACWRLVARPSGGSTCVVAYTNWTKLSFGIFDSVLYIYIYILYMYNNYNMCEYVGTQVCRHVDLYVCVCMYMFVCICMFCMFFVRFCMYLYDLYVFVCICTGLCVCVYWYYLYVCILLYLLAAGKL